MINYAIATTQDDKIKYISRYLEQRITVCEHEISKHIHANPERAEIEVAKREALKSVMRFVEKTRLNFFE